MRETFESWAATEIARLRIEADTLQRALDRYLESQVGRTINQPRLNGGGAPRTSRSSPTKVRQGTKRSFVLARIGESSAGATTGELFDAVTRSFPDMRRNSLRAMRYLQAKSGNIVKNGYRYVLKQDRPSAPSLDLSDQF